MAYGTKTHAWRLRILKVKGHTRRSSRQHQNRHQRDCQQQRDYQQHKLTVPSKSKRAERAVRSTVTARRIGVPSSMKSSALTVPTCRVNTGAEGGGGRGRCLSRACFMGTHA